METGLMFFVNSILLGFALAMDSFSVSVADTLNEPEMSKSKRFAIAGTFGFFQAAMPLIGWVLIHTMLEKFKAFEPFIPWIALVLLLYIGGKMLLEGIKGDAEEDSSSNKLTAWGLFVQGIATAIDALSVGFTIADYTFPSALCSVAIVGTVTFFISLIGCFIGRKVGNKLSGKASILGGVILIGIGLEIFITGVFF